MFVRSSLDQDNLSDAHLLEILREKDRSLVDFEQTDCLQKNEIAELQQESKLLQEQLDLMTTLIKVKMARLNYLDNYIIN